MLKCRAKIRFCLEYIPTVEVRNRLNQLKSKKATEHDGFPPNVIKDCADCLAQPLSYISNLSLSTGICPDEFHYMKVARVISWKTTGRYLFCLSWLKLQRE